MWKVQYTYEYELAPAKCAILGRCRKTGGNKTWRKYWHALWQAVTFAAGNYSNIWDTQDEEVYTIVNLSDTRKHES